jgi:hypothetical protein
MIPKPPDLALANQWLLMEDSQDILASVRKEHKLRGNLILGYAYIDHAAGFTVDVHCFVERKLFGGYSKSAEIQRDLRTMLKIRFDMVRTMKVLPVNDRDRISTFQLPDNPDWLEHYRMPEVEPLRELDFLHPVRAPGFPDDIAFVMGPRGAATQPERVWGRLVRQLSDHVFECTLLNQPHQDFGIKMGDKVTVGVGLTPQGIISTMLENSDKPSDEPPKA